LPPAVITSPASFSISPRGAWLPGSQAGNSRVVRPACATGIVSVTEKMPRVTSVVSTLRSIVPG
jgi:hypothetical protein